MSQMNRICWVAAVCMLLAALDAAAGPDQVEQRKCQVVQAALERQGQALIDPALLKAISRAEALFDIELGVSEEATLVTLRSTGRSLCEAFALDEGRRVVVDLYNTINFRSGTIAAPETQSLVRQVRTSLFAIEPQFVSRVVIDLAAPCVYEVSRDEKQIVIDLTVTNRFPGTQSALSGAITKAARDLTDRKVRIQVLMAGFEESEKRAEDAIENRQAALENHEAQYGEGEAARVPNAPQEPRAAIRRPDMATRARTALCSLIVEHERIQEDVRARCRYYGDIMLRRIESMEAAVKTLQKAVEAKETTEAEAWATLQMQQDTLERANSEGAQLLEDIQDRQQAAQSTLGEGFNALELMLAGSGAEASSQEAPEQPLSQLAAELERLTVTEWTQDAGGDAGAAAIEPAEGNGKPMRLSFADLTKAAYGARDMVVSAAAHGVSSMHGAQSRLARLAEGWGAALSRVETAVRNSQEKQAAPTDGMPPERAQSVLLADSAGEIDGSPLAQAGEPMQPSVEEQRIAELATELEAVKSAEPDLQSDLLAPLAALAGQVGREESAVPSERPRTAPPGKRVSSPQADADMAWHTIERPPLDDESFVVAQAAEAVGVAEAEEVPRIYRPQAEAAPAEAEPARFARTTVAGDPLEQIVDIDFRDMELSHVVGLLADKAHINMVAGVDVKGKVTARLSNVPLRQAMETVLRLNGLGFIQEGAIYRIVPYQEVVSAMQVRRIISLENAKVDDVKATLQEIVVGMPESQQVTLSANASMNVLILAGPEDRVMELEDVIRQIDVAEPVLPTVTEAIKLNYATPSELLGSLGKGMVSEDIGQVSADDRGRFLIVTDIPIKVEQIRELVKQLDMPVKQVSIDAMIVDAVLVDDSETGVDWLLNAVRSVNTRGHTISNLKELFLDTTMPGPTASQLTFDILSSDINLKGVIGAQVKDNKGRLLANPTIVTVENQPATINISQEIPYEKRDQSMTGPPMVSTAFKDVGTILEVTPRVTHDEHVLVKVMAKQSAVGETTASGVPVEIKRETETSLRTKNNQTIFIGGLRGHDTHADVTKVPVLGDVPVVNFLFKHNSVRKQSTELLIFLTCNVLPDEPPELTPEQQAEYDRLEQLPEVTNSQKELFHTVTHPNEYSPPVWRRTR